MKKHDLQQFQYYLIKVESHLNQKWSDWFEGLEITYEGENTVLKGQIKDQAVLHRLLNRMADLNLTLISVNLIDSDKKANIEDKLNK